ncbi:MAG: type I pullulanase, partial [Clostridia bacterium]|nr:type I pullulanase [Clostridia bacterium]
VWSVTLSGDYKNVYYTYLVTAKNIFGNVVTNETQDVYSKAVGANGNRSMVVDLDSTDPEGWDSDTNVCHANKTESAVWELHIRDFSCDPDSGVSEANQGNYLAFTEGGTTYKKQGTTATCLDYLVENNINTVQLMPFADFDGVDEIYGASYKDRNWGYNPKNFNVPDGSYASNSYDGNVRINEVKQMIQALHDRGISVVMDVVYNHTAGSEGSSFTKTVPGYYYRMQSSLANIDGSGQGNEMASDKKMMRNFIVQSLKYWAEEYHIDGFRFDLMGCIDLTTLNQARTTLNGINKNILMYGEPWAGGTTANPSSPSEKNGSSYASGLGAFSGTFRTAASKVDSDKSVTQGWVGGTSSSVSTVVSGIKANLMDSSDNTKTVNYLDCHDNLTLWDRLVGAYTKSGEGKSSVTVNTNVNSTTQKYLRQLKLGGVMLYTSQGITFMNSGIEFARTKQGQGNSYNSEDKYNMLDWSRAGTYKSSVDYYRGLRQIKEVYTPFNDDTNTSKNTMSFISQTGNLIAYTISNNTANKANEWGKVAVLMNSGSSASSVTLSGNWTVVANADNAGLTSLGTASGSYSVPANSAAILVETSGYKDFSSKFSYATLTTKHVL